MISTAEDCSKLLTKLNNIKGIRKLMVNLVVFNTFGPLLDKILGVAMGKWEFAL